MGPGVCGCLAIPRIFWRRPQNKALQATTPCVLGFMELVSLYTSHQWLVANILHGTLHGPHDGDLESKPRRSCRGNLCVMYKGIISSTPHFWADSASTNRVQVEDFRDNFRKRWRTAPSSTRRLTHFYACLNAFSRSSSLVQIGRTRIIQSV